MDKRTFLKQAALAGVGVPLSHSALAGLSGWIRRFEHLSSRDLAYAEDFWAGVRSGYNLNYNIMPTEILEAFMSRVREVNMEGAHYMRTVQFDNKKAVAARLAVLGGCSPEELVITRNTTESLDLIIGGIHWKEGDEAIMAEQDYGSMLEMFRQVGARYGVVNKILSIPNHPASDEDLVALYAGAITSRTRLIMLSHMINITGQILPIRKICDMAHERGVQVMVDGAHTYAHVQFTIPDLHCDYFGASLHKWLSAPLGSGLLYVRRDHIPELWPIFAEPDHSATGIAVLNHTGTVPVHSDLAINAALDYYINLGPARKEERLRYLQQYWTSQVRDIPHVSVNTPADPSRTCGIANVGIQGMAPAALADVLMKRYKIYTVAIDGAGVHGVRVTPNVYTLPSELDVLVRACKELS